MHTIENEDRSLTRFIQTIQEQESRKQDYLANTTQLQFRTISENDSEPTSQLVMEASGGLPTTILDCNKVARDQIASKAGIDVRTFERFRTHYPQQFDPLINEVFQREPAQRMIRTYMDKIPSKRGKECSENRGTARAVLSDKFKTFDNTHLVNAALPQLLDSDAQWKIVNADVTDMRMYLRLKSEVITGEGAGVGDLMALGLGLSNSEVGHGSVSVFQMFWTLICLNGMQTGNNHRSTHITSARAETDTWGLLTDEAKDADNYALELKVRDLVAGFSSRNAFDEVIEKMRLAGEDTIEGSPNQAVEALGKVLQLTKKDTGNVLDGLLATIGQAGYAGKPVSRATMVNAVTAVANTAQPDDVDDWQKLGGRVLELPKSDWQRVALAA